MKLEEIGVAGRVYFYGRLGMVELGQAGYSAVLKDTITKMVDDVKEEFFRAVWE